MSFWNNPENNYLKVVLLVLVFVMCGYFTLTSVHTNGLNGRGQVVNQQATPETSAAALAVSIDPTMKDCRPETDVNGVLIKWKCGRCSLEISNSMNQNENITFAGTTNGNTSCVPNTQQDTPTALGLVKTFGKSPSITLTTKNSDCSVAWSANPKDTTTGTIVGSLCVIPRPVLDTQTGTPAKDTSPVFANVWNYFTETYPDTN